MRLTSSELIYVCMLVCAVHVFCDHFVWVRARALRAGRERQSTEQRERASKRVSIRYTRVQIDKCKYMYTDRQTCIHMKGKTFIRTYTHTHITSIHKHTNIHSHTHAHTHADAHAHTQTHTHTHKYTHDSCTTGVSATYCNILQQREATHPLYICRHIYMQTFRHTYMQTCTWLRFDSCEV